MYELFKPPYAGTDVYHSLTKMFSEIKHQLRIPSFLEKMSITVSIKTEDLKVIFLMTEEFLMLPSCDQF